MLPFVVFLFVCLSCSCIVLKRQKTSTRLLLQLMSLPDRVKICPTQSIPSSPYFAPVDLSVGDIQWQIVVEWLEIEQWSQWRAYRKPPSLIWMLPLLTLYDLHFPKNEGPKCPPWRLLWAAYCHLANMIEDIDKISFAYNSPIDPCHLLLNYFGLW